MKLKRYENNPIIAPDPLSDWQSLSTTNPGAWYDAEKSRVILLYRAAGDEPKHITRFGMAESADGFNFTQVSNSPVFSPSECGPDSGCVEDPRIVKYGNDCFITYAARANPPGQYWLKHEERGWRSPECPETFPYLYRSNLTATYLAITRDFKTYSRVGRLTNPLLDDRDVILFPEKINGKYYMMHRPMTCNGGSVGGLKTPTIWLSSGTDILSMGNSSPLCLLKFDWEEKKIGGNTPPLRTSAGWLMLYHGVKGELASSVYSVSAMILDLNNPMLQSWEI